MGRIKARRGRRGGSVPVLTVQTSRHREREQHARPGHARCGHCGHCAGGHRYRIDAPHPRKKHRHRPAIVSGIAAHCHHDGGNVSRPRRGRKRLQGAFRAIQIPVAGQHHGVAQRHLGGAVQCNRVRRSVRGGGPVRRTLARVELRRTGQRSSIGSILQFVARHQAQCQVHRERTKTHHHGEHQCHCHCHCAALALRCGCAAAPLDRACGTN